MELGENAKETALREMQEESGIYALAQDVQEIGKVHNTTYFEYHISEEKLRNFQEGWNQRDEKEKRSLPKASWECFKPRNVHFENDKAIMCRHYVKRNDTGSEGNAQQHTAHSHGSRVEDHSRLREMLRGGNPGYNSSLGNVHRDMTRDKHHREPQRRQRSSSRGKTRGSSRDLMRRANHLLRSRSRTENDRRGRRMSPPPRETRRIRYDSEDEPWQGQPVTHARLRERLEEQSTPPSTKNDTHETPRGSKRGSPDDLTHRSPSSDERHKIVRIRERSNTPVDLTRHHSPTPERDTVIALTEVFLRGEDCNLRFESAISPKDLFQSAILELNATVRDHKSGENIKYEADRITPRKEVLVKFPVHDYSIWNAAHKATVRKQHDMVHATLYVSTNSKPYRLNLQCRQGWIYIKPQIAEWADQLAHMISPK